MELQADPVSTMVDRIVRAFAPLRIILFGSRARGEARPDSDVDLLVVLPTVSDTRQAAIAIRRVLADIPVAKDILVASPADLERRASHIGDVLRYALAEGKVVHEARR